MIKETTKKHDQTKCCSELRTIYSKHRILSQSRSFTMNMKEAREKKTIQFTRSNTYTIGCSYLN